MSFRISRALMLCAVLASTGCSALNLSTMLDREEAQNEERDTKARSAIRGETGFSKLIGDYIHMADAGSMKVESVGLVVGLSGRGENPPASYLRTMLLNDLRRRKVENPEELLSSGDNCLVIVTARIPPVLKKGEKLDIEVSLPDGSKAKSLAGGYLMPCYLREHMAAEGIREGVEMVVATGPVLVDALGTAKPGDSPLAGHLHGRIPAGGVYTKQDRVLSIVVANEVRSVRMTQQIASSIGSRFFDYNDHGIQVPMAEAKNDVRIELLVHRNYKDNNARYLQVISNLALRENTVDKHVRMQQLSQQIQGGPTAEKAALQLEAIGTDSIPVLKQGLSSPDLEARFHSAVALAYLGSVDGVPALREAIEKEPAFRVYAFAAMATLQDGTAFEALQGLMSQPSVETRYGAFRAMTTIMPDDPSVRGVELGQGSFRLHAIKCDGPPQIHLTRSKKCEVVIFGADQKFQTPVSLRAGEHIIIKNTPEGDRVTVKRIAVGDSREETVPNTVAAVIHAAAEMGAMYPEIVQLIVQAQRQHNLQGAVAIDELPRPGRMYKRPTNTGDGANVQVGAAGLQPNLFDENDSRSPLSEAPAGESREGTNSSEMFLKP